MQPEERSIASLLSGISLFSGLGQEELDRLASCCRVIGFGRAQTIFSKGDPAEGFYYVLRGKVKLFFVSERGGEKVVEMLREGTSFGEAVMFIDQPYPVFAEAMTDTRLLYVQKAGLLEMIDRDPRVGMRMLAGLSRRMHRLIAGQEALCVMTSRERVVGYLLSLPAREDGECDQLELPATKVVVASMLNLTAETFSRILHSLEREGILAITGRRILILDRERLRACSSC